MTTMANTRTQKSNTSTKEVNASAEGRSSLSKESNGKHLNKEKITFRELLMKIETSKNFSWCLILYLSKRFHKLKKAEEIT